MNEITRREVIQLAALGMPLIRRIGELPSPTQAMPGVGENTKDGLIVRQLKPDNLESPFSDSISEITPNEKFFVRSHFSVPATSKEEWRLTVEGQVSQPLELTLGQLASARQTHLVATLECAGNSRAFLTPAVKGVQWSLGAVSTATWTGVRVSDLLKKAGVKKAAIEAVFVGADGGEIKDPPKPSGTIPFARSLPLSRAMDPEVIIATHMNGVPLPVAHGYPARLVVPGWYGVASVKWLSKIILVERPFNGHFQTIDYAYWERRNGLPSRIPVGEMQTKAEISRPTSGEKIEAGRAYRITGAAWTGDAEISRVEVSSDKGVSWQSARLLGRSKRHAWRLWELNWDAPQTPGTVELLVRATDSRGNTQPMVRQADRENYMINHVLPVPVNIVKNS